MQRLFKRSGLPAPTPEFTTEGGLYRLDFAYPAIRFAIEVDGYTWHHSPEQVARDQTRRNRLRSQGWTILEYNWQTVTKEPDRVIAEIRETYFRLAA